MLIKDFLPAVNRYAAAAAKQVSDKKALLAELSTTSEEALVSNLTEISNRIAAGVTTLKEATAKAESTVGMQKQADLFLTEVLPVMEELKNAANEAEIKFLMKYFHIRPMTICYFTSKETAPWNYSQIWK